ncbi:hypothetical protein K438DRAFT_2118253 [Mycena galopus ATCC 62051]|nr:hypothetical protein K438DRAFT_2118253 [Mycena galopus ATCC 62051]
MNYIDEILHAEDDLSEDAADDLPTQDGSNSPLVESDTVWEDGAAFFVRTGIFHPMRSVTVNRMEYCNGPASVYPIHHTRTGLVVDMSHEKYHFCHPTTKELYSINSIIQNSDNDGRKTKGGSGKAEVVFAPGEAAVDGKAVRFKCNGATACDRLSPTLRTDVCFELDLASRDAIIAAQQDTRRREGTTGEERATMFMAIVRGAKCLAVDSKGRRCMGGPMVKAKSQGMSRGHQYFVACSGWSTKFKEGHRTHSIPDHVDEHLLIKALAGQPLTDDRTKDTRPCSAIIHPHIGRKKKTCPHPHIVDGTAVQGQIEAYDCPATRTIYIPKDRSIRKVLIIHNNTGHNHPMPTIIKVTFGLKDTYRQCIDAHGVLGAMVAKVDNAQSTRMVLSGKKPSEHAPALYNKRIKNDLLHAKKIEKYPNGLGVEAIRSMFCDELAKFSNARYIHSYINTPKGETIIVTCVPALLGLLDDPGVTSFDGDTTFKGIEGKINEWELTIFAKVVQRAASILRTFISGASADFFELLFDEIQWIKLYFTSKPLPFKTFVRGGNLLVTNVDMDAAQVIGLSRSVLKYSDPEYSGIPKDTPPEKVAPKSIKVCWRHAKEPIHDFKSLVSVSDFNRLMDCVYIEDKDALDKFTAFVYGLGIKIITDWWKHKEMHEWIIPCMVKSQSGIPADVWDATPSTTNTNEAQHHWTNSLTGIQLTPVEALESRRKVDSDVAQEIEMSLSTGVLANPNNEMSNRIARSSQRRSAAARKASESREAEDLSKEIRLQIDASTARTKELRAQLKASKSSSTRNAAVVLSASSSGCVRSARRRTEVPVVEQALNNALPPATESAFDFPNWDVAMGTSSLENPTFPPQAGSSTSVDPVWSGGQTTYGFDTLLPDSPPALGADDFEDFLNVYGLTSSPRLFGDGATLGNSYLDPFFISSHGTADDSANSRFSDISPGFGAHTDFLHTQPTPLDHWPLLPLPPPESPPPHSPAVQKPSESGPSAPKSRRLRSEVDPALILPATSTRSRVPSFRKRNTDDDTSERPQKKGKGRANQ